MNTDEHWGTLDEHWWTLRNTRWTLLVLPHRHFGGVLEEWGVLVDHRQCSSTIPQYSSSIPQCSCSIPQCSCSIRQCWPSKAVLHQDCRYFKFTVGPSIPEEVHMFPSTFDWHILQNSILVSLPYCVLISKLEGVKWYTRSYIKKCL